MNRATSVDVYDSQTSQYHRAFQASSTIPTKKTRHAIGSPVTCRDYLSAVY